MSEYHDWHFDTDSIIRRRNQQMMDKYIYLLKVSNSENLKSIINAHQSYKIKNSLNLMYGIFLKKYDYLYHQNIDNDLLKPIIIGFWENLKMCKLEDFEPLGNKIYSDVSCFYKYCLESLK